MSISHWIDKIIRGSRRKAGDKDAPELTEGWIQSLVEIMDRLDVLNRSTEQEFLHIGEKLQGFYSRAQDMSEISSHVVDLMTGGEIAESTQGLTAILEGLKHHLGESEGDFTRISDILTQYLDTLRRAGSNLDELRMLVLNLSMLGFLTRVENAHVFSSDTGFASLTDDVKKLSQSINEKSSHIKSRSRALIEIIDQAISEVALTQRSQKEHARSMLENTVSNQRILEQKHDSATQCAQRIAAKSLDVTQNIGDIVSSLQFHDITRQQIEHVKEVFDKLISIIGGMEYSTGEKAMIVADVCTLQGAQLDQSRSELSSAATNIIDNLNNLIQGISEIVTETEKVAWASDIDGLGFMEEIDKGITTMIRSLDENIAQQVRLTDTVASVSEMVSEMSLFIQEIEHMGQNLQLIALNARIKAAHIGHEGAALDTISGGIYELSKNSRNDTKTLSDMLGAIVSTAQGFDSDLALIQGSQKEQVGNMVENLHGIIDSLHGLNENVLSIITRMNSLAESLVVDIHTATKEITIQKEIEGILHEAQESMNSLISEASLLNPGAPADRDKSYLKDFDKLYTMKSEREIHFRHMENAGVPDPHDAQGDSPDELGDNVELF